MDKHELRNVEFRDIQITKATVDILLKQEEPMKLLGLYSFYYYTAIWQGTNQPKAVNAFVARGLKMNKGTIQKYKTILTKMGLVKTITKRDPKTKAVLGHYIQVCYYATSPKNHPLEKQGQNGARRRKSQRLGNPPPNAYRAINEKGQSDRKSFFGDATKENFYEKCAKKLEGALRKKRKITGKVVRIRWVKFFIYLHTTDNVDKSRIKKVLFWYCKNIGKKYTPRVFSGESFREKFLQIENVMDIQLQKEAETEEQKTIASEEAKKMAAHFGHLVWPKGSYKDLPEMIEITMTEWRKLKDYLKSVPMDENKMTGHMRFCRAVLEHLSDLNVFVELWVQSVWEDVRNWDMWRGNLLSMAFQPSPKNKRFLAWVDSWAVQYFGSEAAMGLMVKFWNHYEEHHSEN
jgi:hypothetical protein